MDLFFQNALVEYIGVHTDTNKGKVPKVSDHFANIAQFRLLVTVLLRGQNQNNDNNNKNPFS